MKQQRGARPRQRARERRAPEQVAERPAQKSLIDRHMPVADIVEIRHILVDATPEATHEAVRRIDFAAVPSPLVRALIAIGVRAANRARRQRGRGPLPAKLTIDNLDQLGGIILVDEPGKEIMIGQIERPGDMESRLERRTAEEFEAFDCPGFVKGVASFRVTAHGAKQTLLTYEVRSRATDTKTRRRLFSMDRLMGPLSRLVMQRVVEYMKSNAERACAARRERVEQSA
jgi:hypothetical protein